MTKKDTGGPASCKWCEKPPHIRQGRIMLCDVHYRISSMRSAAKRHGKACPSTGEIESLIPNPFVCIGCDREMHWLRGTGPVSQQATLQHDRNGEIKIICFGCNTRHASHPDDTFYEIPNGHKFCPDCREVKPQSNFSKDASRPIGLKSYCKPCSSKRHEKWRNKNAY